MNSKSTALALAGIAIVSMITGCIKPYDKPEFVEIQPQETAFVIPMEGGAETQNSFKSAELLANKMVATSRIQIPHRWVRTGRLSNQGKYVDTVRVIKVDRTPVTRVWDADPAKGTAAMNQEIKAESRDSLFISSGFTLTAYIEPQDAPLYLYRYKGGKLSDVIDNQVKNSVQAIFSRECAKYDLVELPKNKAEITEAIRNEVIPFYKKWGITLAEDMGFVGGLAYSPKIQEAIDQVFEAQKAKERAEADRVAQEVTNTKELSIAENAAAIKKVEADAEAYAVMQKAEAIKQAGDIYIQAQLIKKWDGVMPKVSSNGGLMNMINATDIK